MVPIVDNMKETKAPGERYRSPAVEQASQILFFLAGARSPYMSLIEISARVGIHKSKAFSILEALQKFGLVQRNVDGAGYGLGPGLVSLSRRVLDDLSPPRLAQPILEELARHTDSTAVLGLITDGNVFIAAKCEGEGSVGVTMRIGHRLPLTYGAHGKAIAAFMPQEERDRLLQRKDLYFHGKASKLNKTRLRQELSQCRRDGFAEDLGVVNRGLNVVAAPVFGPSGTPVGFIEVFVLFSPEGVHRFGPMVAEAGKALSRQLGAEVDNAPADESTKRQLSTDKRVKNNGKNKNVGQEKE